MLMLMLPLLMPIFADAMMMPLYATLRC